MYIYFWKHQVLVSKIRKHNLEFIISLKTKYKIRKREVTTHNTINTCIINNEQYPLKAKCKASRRIGNKIS